MNIRTGIALLALATLTACGGGGGGSSSSAGPTENAAIGGWSGTTTEGEEVSTLVLDDGTVWGLVADAGAAYALFHAPASSTSGNSFTASSPRIYYFGNGEFISGTLTGTVNASTFGGSASGPGGAVGFNMASVPEFNTPATLAQAAGNWSGSFGDLTGVETITNAFVSTAGAISVTVSGCNITGQLTPRPGVAAYNVTLQYRVAAGCLANVDVTGIATVNDEDDQLFIGIINSDRSNAGLAILFRQPV